MAVTLAVTLDTTTQQDLGPMRGAPSGRVQERLKIVGTAAAAGDTSNVYIPAYCHANCQVLGGAFFVSSETDTVGGASIVITAISAIGSNTVYVDLEGQF